MISPKFPLDLEIKPLIGMVHLPPLLDPFDKPKTIDEIFEISFEDAKTLEKTGFDAVLIENFHDIPYPKYRLDEARYSVMSLIVNKIISKLRIPCGVNILRNACEQALVMATVSQASFIRCNIWEGAYITDQGLIESVADCVHQKSWELRSKVKILADIHVKHAQPLGNFSLTEAAVNAIRRGSADAVIVSGKETGKLIDISKLANLVESTNVKPILGSGLTTKNLVTVFPYINGAIAGSSIKVGALSTPIDYGKALDLATVWKTEREKEKKG